MYLLMIWGVLWLFSRPLAFFHVSLSNRQLLISAAAVIVVLVIVFVWWVVRDESAETAPPNVSPNPDMHQPGPKRDSFVEYLAKLRQSPGDVPISLLAAGFVVFFLALVLCVLSLRGVAYLWNPEWSNLFTSTYVIGGALTGAVLYVVSMLLTLATSWLEDAESSNRVVGFVVVSVILSAMYLSMAAYYSYSLYPRLPRGFGGGSPEPVVVWLASDAQSGASQSGTCSREAETVVRCDGLSLFFLDTDNVVLVSSTDRSRPGILLRRDQVRAIGWSMH
jgi:hypothetical protein